MSRVAAACKRARLVPYVCHYRWMGRIRLQCNAMFLTQARTAKVCRGASRRRRDRALCQCAEGLIAPFQRMRHRAPRKLEGLGLRWRSLARRGEVGSAEHPPPRCGRPQASPARGVHGEPLPIKVGVRVRQPSGPAIGPCKPLLRRGSSTRVPAFQVQVPLAAGPVGRPGRPPPAFFGGGPWWVFGQCRS